MIRKKADSGTREYIYTGSESGFRVRRGSYIGVVRSLDGQYEFLVRDTRREGPTIHGSGVDFVHATAAVTELLDALMQQP
jgi:hypothetical protein